MNQTILAAAFCAALLSAPAVHAQSFLDSFRSTVSATGPLSDGAATATARRTPYGWTDLAYTPPVYEGATHLRIGRSAVTGSLSRDKRLALTARGKATCDLNYLYHAKAGIRPAPAEMEYCVRLELVVLEERTGQRRDLTDAFVLADSIKELTPWINARIESFAQAKRFYFRSTTMYLEPYDIASQQFNGVLLLGSSDSTNGYRFEMINHAFIGRAIDSNSNYYRATFGMPEQAARELERSRNASLIDDGRSVVSFALDKVSVGTVNRKMNLRQYHVSDVVWDLPWYRPDGPGSILEIK